MPAGKGVAGERDDRHAHPQGVARGETAGEGEGVQRDVDFGVLGQTLAMRRPAAGFFRLPSFELLDNPFQ